LKSLIDSLSKKLFKTEKRVNRDLEKVETKGVRAFPRFDNPPKELCYMEIQTFSKVTV